MIHTWFIFAIVEPVYNPDHSLTVKLAWNVKLFFHVLVTQLWTVWLSGEYDHLPEAAFYMVGDINDVIEKADRLAEEHGS